MLKALSLFEVTPFLPWLPLFLGEGDEVPYAEVTA